VLYRQTSFGTFGGGGDANISIPCINICGTSGGNTTPGGNGGIGSPVPGSSTAPGGHTAPGGNTTPGGDGGGAGKSVAWSTRRTDPDDTVVSPAPSNAASKSANSAMAADAAKITRITRRR
jgi:hypothetical protein